MLLAGLRTHREVKQNALLYTEKVGNAILLHITLLFKPKRTLALRESHRNIGCE